MEKNIKTVEEKAREYKESKYQQRIVIANSYFDSVDIELAYKDGYQSRNEEVKQLIGALEDATRWRKVSEELPCGKIEILCKRGSEPAFILSLDTGIPFENAIGFFTHWKPI